MREVYMRQEDDGKTIVAEKTQDARTVEILEGKMADKTITEVERIRRQVEGAADRMDKDRERLQGRIEKEAQGFLGKIASQVNKVSQTNNGMGGNRGMASGSFSNLGNLFGGSSGKAGRGNLFD